MKPYIRVFIFFLKHVYNSIINSVKFLLLSYIVALLNIIIISIFSTHDSQFHLNIYSILLTTIFCTMISICDANEINNRSFLQLGFIVHLVCTCTIFCIVTIDTLHSFKVKIPLNVYFYSSIVLFVLSILILLKVNYDNSVTEEKKEQNKIKFLGNLEKKAVFGNEEFKI